jgi:hypothetical protein
VQFNKKYDPRYLFQIGLNSGWRLGNEGGVMYLLPDDDDFSWNSMISREFSLECFLSALTCEGGKLGITVMFDSKRGGEIIIYPEKLFIQLSINQLRDDNSIVDFSWYLRKLSKFLTHIEIVSIECLQIM